MEPRLGADAHNLREVDLDLVVFVTGIFLSHSFVAGVPADMQSLHWIEKHHSATI